MIWKDCPRCSGSGRYLPGINCSQCHGKGRIEVEDRPPIEERQDFVHLFLPCRLAPARPEEWDSSVGLARIAIFNEHNA